MQPTPIKSICSWCNRTLRDGSLPASHDICPDCLRSMAHPWPCLANLIPERNLTLEDQERRFARHQAEDNTLKTALLFLLLGAFCFLAMFW